MKTFHKEKATWLCLLLAGLAMTVLMQGAFFMDDALLSYLTKAAIDAPGGSLGNYIWGNIHSWLTQGRLFPVSNAYVSALMYFVPNAFVYKSIIWFFVILDIYVYGAFLWKLTESKWFTYLNMAVVPLMIQIRYYHDGVVGYHLLMQVVLLCILLSGLTLIKFKETKKWPWLLVSLFCYTLGLLTYEIAFITILVLCFLAFCPKDCTLREMFSWKNIKQTFFSILPFFLITVVILAITSYFKNTYGTNYDGITVGTNIRRIFVTFLKQAFAAFPLSYYDRIGLGMNKDIRSVLKAVTWLDLVVLALFILVMVKSIKGKENLHKSYRLWGVALVLWLVPSMIIGISIRYQSELYWGVGHIPVYIEYFGILLFFSLVFSWVRSLLKNELAKKILNGVLIAGLSGIFLLNLQNNRIITGILNDAFLYSRDLMDESLDAGILDMLPDESTLIVQNEIIYFNYPGDDYFSYKTGKKVKTYRPYSYAEAMREGLEFQPDNTYVLSYEATKDKAYLCVGKVKELSLSADGLELENCLVDKMWLYDKEDNVTDLIVFTGGENPQMETVKFSDKKVVEVPSESGKIFYQMSFENGAQFNGKRINVEGVILESVESQFKGDFYTMEGNPEDIHFRWCGYDSKLQLTNFENEEKTVEFSFTLATSSEGEVKIAIAGMDVQEEYTVTKEEGIPVTLSLTLKPGTQYLTFTAEGEPLEVETDARTLLYRLENESMKVLK